MASLLSKVRNRGKRSLIQASVQMLKVLLSALGMILFGSHARGEAIPISDIGLCVLGDLKFPKEERLEALDYLKRGEHKLVL